MLFDIAPTSSATLNHFPAFTQKDNTGVTMACGSFKFTLTPDNDIVLKSNGEHNFSIGSSSIDQPENSSYTAFIVNETDPSVELEFNTSLTT